MYLRIIHGPNPPHLQRELGHHLLFAIHDLDAELRGIRLAHEEHDALIVAHRLHELEEVDHVDAEYVLLGAVELVEAIGLEAQMNEDRVGAVHRHDLEAGAVELEVCVGKDVFDSFDECPERCGLDSTYAEEHVRAGRIHSIPWVVLRV